MADRELIIRLAGDSQLMLMGTRMYGLMSLLPVSDITDWCKTSAGRPRSYVLIVMLILTVLSCKERASTDFSTTKGPHAGTDNFKQRIIHYETFKAKSHEYCPVLLSENDVAVVEVLLDKSIRDWNERRLVKINLSDYSRFYTPVLNKSNEKEVWVYCSCTGRREFVIDGGKCYFSLKLNLTKKTYSTLKINNQG